MASRNARQLALEFDPPSRRSASVASRSGAPTPLQPVRPPRRPRQSLRALEKAGALADRLSLLLAEPVRLTITNNTSTMVSFRRSRRVVAFRVHKMFLDAPSSVVRALADYASERRCDAGRVIDVFVHRNEARIRKARIERQARGLDPFGRVHDLQAIFDALNEAFFSGRIDARIGWGREAPNRRRRSIKMGTYLHDARVIRIHPALDREEVPPFFVRFVVFHEMLHQAIPPQHIGGRRVSHSPEYRAWERSYPGYERALAWERDHLPLLLGERRRPRVFDPDDLLA